MMSHGHSHGGNGQHGASSSSHASHSHSSLSSSSWSADEPKSKDEERRMAIAMYLILHVFMIVGLLIRPTGVRQAIDDGHIILPIALFGSASIAIILYIRASYSSPGYVEGPSHFEAPPSYEMVRPAAAVASSSSSSSLVASLPLSSVSSTVAMSVSSLPSYTSLMDSKTSVSLHDDDIGCVPIPSPLLSSSASSSPSPSLRVATVKRLSVAAAANDDNNNDNDNDQQRLLTVQHTVIDMPSSHHHHHHVDMPLATSIPLVVPPVEDDSDVPDHIKKHPYYRHPHLGHLVDNPAALAALGYAVDPELEEGRFGEGNARAYHAPNATMMMRSLQQRGDDIWCAFCQSMKPMRSKHCHKCKRCIVKFDHHCPFIANCVGGMNHRLFWWYLFWQNIANVWCWQQNWWVWSSNDSTWMWTLALMTTIMLSFMCFTSLALFGFHSYLAVTGRTTWQMIKIQRVRNPPRGHSHASLSSLGVDLAGADDEFNYGIIKNLVIFCCARLRSEWFISPSYTAPSHGVTPPVYDHLSSSHAPSVIPAAAQQQELVTLASNSSSSSSANSESR